MILVISTINLPCTEKGWNSNTVLMMTEEEIQRSATSSDFGVLTKGILLEKLQLSVPKYIEKCKS